MERAQKQKEKEKKKRAKAKKAEKKSQESLINNNSSKASTSDDFAQQDDEKNEVVDICASCGASLYGKVAYAVFDERCCSNECVTKLKRARAAAAAEARFVNKRILMLFVK